MAKKAIEELKKGIALYVEKLLNEAPFDKTVTGIIKDIGTLPNTYNIVINGVEYNNILSYDTHNANDTVKVLIPQNNYNNMFILR